MKRQAAVGKRTRSSKRKQTSLHDFDGSSSTSSDNNRSSRSTATSKRAVEKLRRAAYSSLSADLPKRVKSSDDGKKQSSSRRQRGGDGGGTTAATGIAAGSSSSSDDDGTPCQLEPIQLSSDNDISKRDTTCTDKIEATKPSKRTNTAPRNVETSNDNTGKVNQPIRGGDIAQHNHNRHNNNNDESDQESIEVEVTPAAKITQLRQVTIEPKPLLLHNQQHQPQLQDSTQIITPHFHTSWKPPYTTTNSPPLPPGVIDIDTFHHQCCSHSLISHCGYSWVTSQRRCHCEIDANHNTSESYSQAYLGSYGQERYTTKLTEEWKAEQWCLDRAISERTAQVERMKQGLEPRWDVRNLPPHFQTQLKVHLDYMFRQPHINTDMRAILMDWLVELAEEYKLTSETLFLSGMLVDRSLAISYGVEGFRGGEMMVQKDQLQCVGCACTMIAAKLLEITPPGADEFVYISDNSYKRKDILEMEANIVNSLGFNLNFVTPYHHVHRFLAASQASSPCSLSADRAAMRLGKHNATNNMMESLVMYLLDLSMLDYAFVNKKPSLVAAAAVYLARCTLGIREPSTATMTPSSLHDEFESPSFQRDVEGYWSKTLQHYTGYDMWALEEPVKRLHKLQEGAETSHLRSVYNKHKKQAHDFVALKVVVKKEDLGFL
mmetsp:Transcript_6918/g.14414  ORF Transcript_6918/g.14414 Transcript_6918/m.14414 type:complete len:662 (+) Transcript_6918:41-2026(+)